jgi:hypothetical protein
MDESPLKTIELGLTIPIAELKARFGNRNADVVNYLVDLAERGVSHEQVEENILTAIAEHPIADSIGQYTYNANWVNGELTFQGSSIEPSLDEGVRNLNGQIPAFEIPRNQANADFYYEKLKPSRNGQVDKEKVFVEFSPSPMNMNDTKVRERGYKGNDTIFVYKTDEDGVENVTQYWFPAINMKEYKELMNQLGKKDCEVNDDISVMYESGEFTQAESEIIINFIEKQQDRFLSPEISDKILEIKDTFIHNQIVDVIMPRLGAILGKYREGLMSESDFENELESLENLMEDLQFQFRLMIRDFTGVNTLSDEVTQKLDQEGMMTHREYYMLDGAERGKLINNVGYALSGCGFGGPKRSPGVWGRSGGILSSNDKELYEFICDKCGTRHDIDVPNGVYVEKCSFCGTNARC